LFCSKDGILRAAFEHGKLELFADDLELLDGRRTIDIARGEQRLFCRIAS
jgi:hypothetical protein